jgi:hypothetical protein
MEKMMRIRTMPVVLGAILMALIGWLFWKNTFALDTSRIMAHEQRKALEKLRLVCDEYFNTHGFYPPVTEGLTVLQDACGHAATADLWGNPLRYSLVGGKPRLVSAGLDMVFGTRDDIER